MITPGLALTDGAKLMSEGTRDYTMHRDRNDCTPPARDGPASRLALALGLLALVTAACRDATSPEVTASNFLINDAVPTCPLGIVSTWGPTATCPSPC